MRKYSSIIPEMAIATTTLTASATTITLDNNSWPAVGSGDKLTLVIDPDTANEEIVYVTAHTASSYDATIIRGQEGTTAREHVVGKKVRHMITAADLQEAHDHMANGRPDLGTGQVPVHNLTGSVVGTTDTQTLTNKTINGSNNTITNISAANVTGLSGTYAPLASPNFSGTPQISGVAIATQAYADGKVAEPASNGIVVRTGDNTSVARSIVAGSGISVTNGDGVSGNITIAATTSGGSGTVTSITAGTGLTGGTITTSGTIAVDTTTVATTTNTVTLTNKTLTSPSVSGLYLSDSSIVFEGSSADAYETTLTVTNPTADRTITLPNATGTVMVGQIGTTSPIDAGVSSVTFSTTVTFPTAFPTGTTPKVFLNISDAGTATPSDRSLLNVQGYATNTTLYIYIRQVNASSFTTADGITVDWMAIP